MKPETLCEMVTLYLYVQDTGLVAEEIAKVLLNVVQAGVMLWRG